MSKFLEMNALVRRIVMANCESAKPVTIGQESAQLEIELDR